MPVDPSAKASGPPPLPELARGVLDAVTLDALHRDYTNLCQVLAVLPRSRSNSHTVPGQTCSLEDGFAGLRDGTISGLQVRYRWDGIEWWDTILTLPGGQARIVRMEQSSSAHLRAPDIPNVPSLPPPMDTSSRDPGSP